MTKKEMEAAIATLTATLKAQNGPVVAPAATVAPAAPAVAAVPWLAAATVAAQAAPKTPKAPKAPHTPLPLTAEIVTINPDAAKGQTWSPFRSLHIHNGKSGRAYRGVKMDRRYVEFVLQHGAAILQQL